MIAGSRSSVGGMVVAAISDSCKSLQSSLKAICPPTAKSCSVGSSIKSFRPDPAREGPTPRTITRLGVFPVIIKPPTITPSPLSTRMRVEMLTGCEVGVPLGLGDGLVLGDGLGLGEALGEGLGLGEALGDGLGLGEALGLGEGLDFDSTRFCADKAGLA